VSFPTGLFEDAVLGARRVLIAWFAWHGNASGFTGVLELPVTSSRGYQVSTVFFE